MIFLTGDIHGNIDIHKLNTLGFPIQQTLTRNDFVIIAGDFGLVWSGDKNDRYWLDWLENKPFTTLFVAGNHENFDLLSTYPVSEWNGGKVQFIRPHVIHLMRGQVFHIDGIKLFAMGGASSVDRVYRTEGVSWWQQELPSAKEYEDAEKNLSAADWSVDLVVTHCAPTSVQVMIDPSFKSDELTNFLDRINERLKFHKWYIGHYHIDATFGKHRVIYNDIVLEENNAEEQEN